MDLDEPCVMQSIDIVKAMISSADDRCRSKSCRLVMAVIPTQELVCADAARSKGALGETYEKMIEMEERCREELFRHCNDRGIPIADPLGHLRTLISQDVQLFPELRDGHYLAPGYAAIADAALSVLRGEGLVR